MHFFDNPPDNGEIILAITTTKSSPVTYTVQTAPGFFPQITRTGTVTRDQPATVTLPKSLRNNNVGIGSKGVTITASDEISVDSVNKGSCAAYLAIPKDALGTEYYVTTWQPVLNEQTANIIVGASEDNTQVTVRFPLYRGVNFNYNGATYDGGATLTFSLNKGQSFTIKDRADLTGTSIKATRPVAVWGGNNKVSIGTTIANDNVVTQFPPVNTWGTRYVLVGVPTDSVGGLLKILALEDSTNVRIKGNVGSVPITEMVFQLSSVSRDFYEVRQIVARANIAIESDKPILAVYYGNGDSSGRGSRPISLLLPPIKSYMNQYSFTPIQASGNTFTTSIMIAVERGRQSGLFRNNQRVSQNGWIDLVTPWSTPQMIVNFVPASSGANYLRHSDPSVRFGAAVYGIDRADCAYAFPAGMRFADGQGGGVSTNIGNGFHAKWGHHFYFLLICLVAHPFTSFLHLQYDT